MTTEAVTPATESDYYSSMGALEYAGVKFVEHEDGDITAYGHIEPRLMARAVSDYYADVLGDQDAVGPDTVTHAYGVLRHEGSQDDDGWFVTWGGITSETPGAFPLTLVDA